jgi:curved DNA-binding protein CbpA
MATFDPYHKWLGIPPEDQPPSHYRLLGIPELESDPDVIDTAAERQTLLLRTFQTSDQAQLAEQFLNEVSAARICLLNTEQKAEYDQQLQAEMQPAPVPPPPVTASPAVVVKPDPPAVPVEQPGPPGRQPRRRKRKTSPFWQQPRMLAAAVGLVVLLLVVLNSGRAKSLPASLQQGLVAYYPFNGNANDESGNGNHGVVTGASLGLDRFGDIGKAYDFDGIDDVVKIAPLNSTAFDAISVSLWVKTTNKTRNKHLFSNYGRPHWFHVLLNPSGNDGRCSVQIDGGFSSPPYCSTTKSIANGQWHHVVACWDKVTGKVKIYLEGSKNVESTTRVKKRLDLTVPIWIGGQVNYRRYFEGVLDDVRIYNRALSPEEVKELYEYEKPISNPKGTAIAKADRNPGGNEPLPNAGREIPGTEVIRNGNGAVTEITFSKLSVADEDLVALQRFPELRHVSLGRTEINDEQLRFLKPLKQLRWLRFFDTAVGNDGLKHLSPLTSLTYLDLTRTKITGDGLVHLRSLPLLRDLRLGGTSLNEGEFSDISNLSSLKWLTIDDSNVTDQELRSLNKLTNLESLLSRGNRLITGTGFRELKPCTRLSSLNLHGSSITDDGLKQIALLASLKILSLANTQVTDIGMPDLQQLVKLETLSLQGTKVSDKGLKFLQKLPNLTQLRVSRTNVTASGISEIKSVLPNLVVIQD